MVCIKSYYPIMSQFIDNLKPKQNETRNTKWLKRIPSRGQIAIPYVSISLPGQHRRSLIGKTSVHLNYLWHTSHELATVALMPLMLLMLAFLPLQYKYCVFVSPQWIFLKSYRELAGSWELGLGLGLGLGRTKNTTKTFSAVKKRDLSCRSIPLSSLLPTWCGNSS